MAAPAGTEQSGRRGADRPGALRRGLVYVFLLAVIGCGLFEIEAWPLSGFRLFSQVRTGTEVRWELVTVDATGAEAPADLSGMGRGFRQSWHLLPHLADAPADEQAKACAGWFAAAPDAVALRAYTSTFEREHPDDVPVLRHRYLRMECAHP